MTMERIFRARDTTSDFNVNNYYLFFNAASPNKTISASYPATNGEINMTKLSTYSSENWQLYYQNGRYFIRNYDFGGDLQLGLQDSNKQTPRLYPRSGALGQQWTIRKAASGNGWTLSNGLLGEESLLALSTKNGPPTMQTNDQATVWDISINESAGSPKDAASFADVEGFVNPSSSSSAISSSSATAAPSSTSKPPSTSPSTSTPTSTLASSSPYPSLSSSPILSTGAMIGISVGAVLAAICVFLVFFLLRRRKRRAAGENAYIDLPENPVYTAASTKVTYGYHQAEMAGPNAGMEGYRAELESPRAELGEGEVGAKHAHRAELG